MDMAEEGDASGGVCQRKGKTTQVSFMFVLFYSYCMHSNWSMTGPDIAPASRLAGKMVELPPRYPSSPLTNESFKTDQNRKEKKGKEMKTQRSMPAAAAPHT